MTSHAATAGKIGPNAITRAAEALRAQAGEIATIKLFRAAGLSHYLEAPPEQMVDECEVVALHGAMRDLLGPEAARHASYAAGMRTADYLLANRIPRPVQYLLRVLPPLLASRVLLSAIRRHSWTFAGTGHFAATAGHPTLLSIAGCPICRGAHAVAPACDYYAATFERLFQVLVSPRAQVQEIACEALGASACVFAVRWRDKRGADRAG